MEETLFHRELCTGVCRNLSLDVYSDMAERIFMATSNFSVALNVLHHNAILSPPSLPSLLGICQDIHNSCFILEKNYIKAKWCTILS